MASLVLARMPPANLLAAGRRKIVVAKKMGSVLTKRDVMEDTVHSWQAFWDSTSEAAWTRQLIPNLSRWISKGPRQISFHTAQARDKLNNFHRTKNLNYIFIF